MKIVFSKKASNKLSSIYFYLAYEQHAPENAEKLITEIREKSQILAVTPKLGVALVNEKIRFIVIKNHVVVYEIKEEVILIIQVYGAGEDWRKKIGEDF